MAAKSGGAVPVNEGGTGSTTASGARTNLGLGDSATGMLERQREQWPLGMTIGSTLLKVFALEGSLEL